ncbi:TIR domain-containing protein [Enterobacter kobei]|uniref:TIR domain-containing protein n=1 Tax=Enterobacter kobei TaxID=208224 RepID=UPI0022E04386|nr:TIR domain-containing protein [Enterobacter kobei]
MKEKPVVFIASSSEASLYAETVNLILAEEMHSEIWKNSFGLSTTTISSIIKKTKEADYAVFIFHPDDKVFIRDVEYDSVRDNVVLELGMFIGSLGIDKCFILLPKSTERVFRLPSDLDGVIGSYYDDQDPKAIRALTPSCTKIKLEVRELEDSKRETQILSTESILRAQLNDAKSQIMTMEFDTQRISESSQNYIDIIKRFFFSVAKPATPLEIKQWEDGAKATQLKEITIPRFKVYIVDQDVPIPPLFGADSISLIVKDGVKVYGDEKCGHSSIYYMEGFRTNKDR